MEWSSFPPPGLVLLLPFNAAKLIQTQQPLLRARTVSDYEERIPIYAQGFQ